MTTLPVKPVTWTQLRPNDTSGALCQWVTSVGLSGGRTLVTWVYYVPYGGSRSQSWLQYACIVDAAGNAGPTIEITPPAVHTDTTVDWSQNTWGNGPQSILVGTDLVLNAMAYGELPYSTYTYLYSISSLTLLNCSGSTPVVVQQTNRTSSANGDDSGRLALSSTQGGTTYQKLAFYYCYDYANSSGTHTVGKACIITCTPTGFTFGAFTAIDYWSGNAPQAGFHAYAGEGFLTTGSSQDDFHTFTAGATVTMSAELSPYPASAFWVYDTYDTRPRASGAPASEFDIQWYGSPGYWPSPNGDGVFYAGWGWSSPLGDVKSLLRLLPDPTTGIPKVTNYYDLWAAGAASIDTTYVAYSDASDVGLYEDPAGLVSLTVVKGYMSSTTLTMRIEYHTDIWGNPTVYELSLPTSVGSGGILHYIASVWLTAAGVTVMLGNSLGEVYPFFGKLGGETPNLSGAPGDTKVHFISSPTGMGPFTMGA